MYRVGHGPQRDASKTVSSPRMRPLIRANAPRLDLRGQGVDVVAREGRIARADEVEVAVPGRAGAGAHADDGRREAEVGSQGAECADRGEQLLGRRRQQGTRAVALVDDLTGRKVGDGDARALSAESVRRERLRDAPRERRILRRLVRRGARDRHADREQAERQQQGAQSPHHRNVMVMVWVPYTDARSAGIQRSIVAPITDDPVSAATHGP